MTFTVRNPAEGIYPATDDYVHDNPWPLIGAAAVVGFLFGLWVRDPD